MMIARRWEEGGTGQLLFNGYKVAVYKMNTS